MKAPESGSKGVAPTRVTRRTVLGVGLLGLSGAGSAVAALSGSDPSHGHRMLGTGGRPQALAAPHPPRAQSPPTRLPPVAVPAKPIYKVTELLPAAPPNAVALTIDDGPHPEWTPRIPDLLARHDVKATFCLIGEQIRQNENEVRMMVEAGHQIANHT
ncbi:hypothetical protein amrb99_15210 [Actinomadura sp. RB99]|uniref:polysaccharide deacetylase family protein n=1 Tax=Actinomadura sp. RB99 TaxID=2691577 RepID=UPI00168757D7|nr:polysaccharide deacetylase family protein [Actinomadura sp. RB99]MBD2892611.1 hypothetical protein [Actinomadura sp. RB99]